MTVTFTFQDDQTAIQLAALLSAAVADREDNNRQTDVEYENLLVGTVQEEVYRL